MNAYGPSFRHITPDHTVFENKTVHKWFSVNIDLNLDDNTANEDRANIFALTDGTEQSWANCCLAQTKNFCLAQNPD